MVSQVPEVLREAVDRTALLLPQLLAALVVLLGFTIAGRFAGRGVARLVRTRGSERLGTVVGRIVHWTLVLLGLVIALQILGLTAVAGSLLATGGLVAVILGFAFRSIGENLLAGVFLGFSRAFEVGDLIESSGHVGVVRDINLRSVHIRSADGRDIFIPCTQIFTNVLVNFTRDGLRRGDFVVGVDYAHDPGEMRDLLLQTTRRIDGVLEDPAPSVQIASFQAQYQELRVLFWVDIYGEIGLNRVRTEVMRACLASLKESRVTLSSDVSSALSIAPLDVALRGRG
jgi:small conductance mechanosensitive channel